MDKYCRLCLSITSEHFNEISNSKYRKQIETVIPELNIKSVQAPLLCQKCSKVLEAAYEFKNHSLRVDKHLTCFIEKENTDVIHLSDVLIIREQLNLDFDSATTDNISFVDIQKIEENNALCDDNFTEDLSSSVKDETKNISAMGLDDDIYKKEHLIDLNTKPVLHYVLSDQDCGTPDNLNIETEGNDDIQTEAKIIQTKNLKTANRNELTCIQCNKKFQNTRQLKRHQSYHTKNKYKCDVNGCNESFVMRTKLVQHKKQHSELTCNTCGHVLRTYRSYQNHLRRHLGLFKCETCGMNFSNTAQLKSHEVVHTGLREFICDLCGKGFGQASTLRMHIGCVHATERPFTCEICGKSFTQLKLKKLHMNAMHLESDRKFTCSICGKSVRFKSSLRDHMKRHSGEKKHVCKICDKRFIDSSGLKKHIIIHGNDKPHECPYCSKRTNQKYNLTIHLRTCVKRKQAQQINGSDETFPVVIGD